VSLIVYTTIFGQSDHLKKAPSGASRCVCFVDDPSVYVGRTRGWELIQHLAPNPRRTAWYLRCIPHLLFPQADKTIWIDASFTLWDLPQLLLDASGHDLAVFQHNSRTSPYTEGQHIVHIRQAGALDVQRQLQQYAAEGFPGDRLSTAGLMVRTTSPRVQAFNERWAAEIAEHPGDNTQLSLDYAAWKVGLHIHHIKGTYKNNPYAHHNYKDHLDGRKPYDTDTTVRRSRR